MNKLAVNLLETAPKTKTEIKEYANNIKTQIMSGDIDVLQAKIILKSFSEMIKELEKDTELKEIFIDEAEKHGKTFEFAGHTINTQSRASYDFTACEDSEWMQLKNNAELAKKQLKAREDFLKGLKNNYINEETGEIIFPPAKKYTDIISITLKK